MAKDKIAVLKVGALKLFLEGCFGKSSDKRDRSLEAENHGISLLCRKILCVDKGEFQILYTLDAVCGRRELVEILCGYGFEKAVFLELGAVERPFGNGSETMYSIVYAPSKRMESFGTSALASATSLVFSESSMLEMAAF